VHRPGASLPIQRIDGPADRTGLRSLASRAGAEISVDISRGQLLKNLHARAI